MWRHLNEFGGWLTTKLAKKLLRYDKLELQLRPVELEYQFIVVSEELCCIIPTENSCAKPLRGQHLRSNDVCCRRIVAGPYLT